MRLSEKEMLCLKDIINKEGLDEDTVEAIRYCIRYQIKRMSGTFLEESITKEKIESMKELLGTDEAPRGKYVIDDRGHQRWLEDEDAEKGYQWLKGDLCDKDGYPVEQDKDLVVRGGEVWATEPKRKEILEKARENMSKVLIEVDGIKVNPKMAELLKEVPISKEVESIHPEGMIANMEQDGVDEVYDD